MSWFIETLQAVTYSRNFICSMFKFKVPAIPFSFSPKIEYQFYTSSMKSSPSRIPLCILLPLRYAQAIFGEVK